MVGDAGSSQDAPTKDADMFSEDPQLGDLKTFDQNQLKIVTDDNSME